MGQRHVFFISVYAAQPVPIKHLRETDTIYERKIKLNVKTKQFVTLYISR